MITIRLFLVTLLAILSFEATCLSQGIGPLSFTNSNRIFVEVGAYTNSLPALKYRRDRPFSTLSNALAVATSGDVVVVGAGWFTNTTGGNNINIPAGVKVIGQGQDATFFNNTGIYIDLKGNGSVLADCSVRGAGLRVSADFSTNLIQNVHVEQTANAALIHVGNTNFLTLRDCILDAGNHANGAYFYDALSNSVAQFWNCHFKGDIGVKYGSLGTPTITNYFFGCLFSCNTTNIHATGGYSTLYHCVLNDPSGNTIFVGANGSVSEFAAVYNPNKAVGTISHLSYPVVNIGSSNIGATSIDGLQIINTNAAAAGAQQYSPALRLTGQGWKTDATAASQSTDWRIYNQPVQGAANPTANLLFDYSLNGGAFSTKAYIRDTGTFKASSGIFNDPSYGFLADSDTGMYFTAGNLILALNSGTPAVALNSANGFQTISSAFIGWSSANVDGTADVRLFRDTAATLALRNSTAAQTFRIYNTYTDASNYERAFTRWTNNVFEVGVEVAGTGTSQDMAFLTAGSTRATIKTDGKVGIGLSAPASELHVATSATSAQRGIISAQHNNDTHGALIILRKSRGTITSPATVASGDTTGGCLSEFYDGTSYLRTAGIAHIVNGVVATGSVPTDLGLYTGTNTSVERWRVTSAGHLLAATDNTYDIGASGATRPRAIYTSGLINAGNNVSIGTYLTFGLGSVIRGSTDGVIKLSNQAETDFNRLQFGGTTSVFPAWQRNAAGFILSGADGTYNSTNSLIVPGDIIATNKLATYGGFYVNNTVDTTPVVAITMNKPAGRVRISAASQSIYVTNSVATANSVVMATINSVDSTASAVQAIPSAGLLRLRCNAVTTADTDISFLIVSP